MLHPGDLAPDFDLPVLMGGVKKRFRLSDRRGKLNLVLAFYPANWEPVSTEQLVGYQVEREKFLECDAEIVAISVDSIMNTAAWERDIGPFDYLLCSDFWPHGSVSMRYGVLREQEPFTGASERAVFIVDKSGVIQFNRIGSIGEVPDTQEILEVLRSL